MTTALAERPPTRRATRTPRLSRQEILLDAVLHRDVFEAWLGAQEPRAIVGEALTGDMCPLANFLGECNVNWPTVGEASVTFYRLAPLMQGQKSMRLPEWAVAFVYAVDALPGHTDEDGFTFRPVTADVALGILAEMA